MNEKEMRELDVEIAQKVFKWKWFWRVDGVTQDEKDFHWVMTLGPEPEEGIGKAWIGCAGETRHAKEDEIAESIKRDRFVFYNQFWSTNSAASMEVLKRCAEKCDQNNRFIKINRTKGMLGDDTKGSSEIWDVMEWDETDMFASSNGQQTLELATSFFAKALFTPKD